MDGVWENTAASVLSPKEVTRIDLILDENNQYSSNNYKALESVHRPKTTPNKVHNRVSLGSTSSVKQSRFSPSRSQSVSRAILSTPHNWKSSQTVGCVEYGDQQSQRKSSGEQMKKSSLRTLVSKNSESGYCSSMSRSRTPASAASSSKQLVFLKENGRESPSIHSVTKASCSESTGGQHLKSTQNNYSLTMSDSPESSLSKCVQERDMIDIKFKNQLNYISVGINKTKGHAITPRMTKRTIQSSDKEFVEPVLFPQTVSESNVEPWLEDEIKEIEPQMVSGIMETDNILTQSDSQSNHSLGRQQGNDRDNYKQVIRSNTAQSNVTTTSRLSSRSGAFTIKSTDNFPRNSSKARLSRTYEHVEIISKHIQDGSARRKTLPLKQDRYKETVKRSRTITVLDSITSGSAWRRKGQISVEDDESTTVEKLEKKNRVKLNYMHMH